MRGTARVFARAVHDLRFAPPSIPVISNRTAAEYPATGIARLLIEQIDHQVRWADSLAYVLRRDPDATFVELGGTPTLGGTVRRALRQVGRAS